MSESMTVEKIIEAYWQLKGFWTKIRFPIQTQKGGWSDIDILAYNPESKELVIAESKAAGRKNAVFAFTKETQEKHGDIIKYGGDYFKFLGQIKLACQDDKIFANFENMVKKLTIHLVSNCFISKNVKIEAETTVQEHIRKDIPSSIEVEINLETTLDVISNIILLENEKKQGRRYGHPIIDIARELNRYMNPQIYDAGSKEAADKIKKEFFKKIGNALGILEITDA